MGYSLETRGPKRDGGGVERPTINFCEMKGRYRCRSDDRGNLETLENSIGNVSAFKR